MAEHRKTITCACCGNTGPAAGRGLIFACYMRHRQLGTLEQFPREIRPGRGTSHPRPVVTCVCCGKRGTHRGRGLINACHVRHAAAGTLERFPVNPESVLEAARHGREARDAAFVGRVEDYAELLSWGESPEQAARRLGVSATTAQKYERILRRRAAA